MLIIIRYRVNFDLPRCLSFSSNTSNVWRIYVPFIAINHIKKFNSKISYDNAITNTSACTYIVKMSCENNHHEIKEMFKIKHHKHSWKKKERVNNLIMDHKLKYVYIWAQYTNINKLYNKINYNIIKYKIGGVTCFT